MVSHVDAIIDAVIELVYDMKLIKREFFCW